MDHRLSNGDHRLSNDDHILAINDTDYLTMIAQRRSEGTAHEDGVLKASQLDLPSLTPLSRAEVK